MRERTQTQTRRRAAAPDSEEQKRKRKRTPLLLLLLATDFEVDAALEGLLVAALASLALELEDNLQTDGWGETRTT